MNRGDRGPQWNEVATLAAERAVELRGNEDSEIGR